MSNYFERKEAREDLAARKSWRAEQYEAWLRAKRLAELTAPIATPPEAETLAAKSPNSEGDDNV